MPIEKKHSLPILSPTTPYPPELPANIKHQLDQINKMPSIPSTHKALKLTTPGHVEVQTVPIPKTDRPGYLLIKVEAVALNPTDWKHVDFLSTEGATSGCDYAGSIVDIGPGVEEKFQIGEKVAGFAHGANALEKQDGAFGEYALVKGDVALRVPKNLSVEEAATLGIGVITVGQALYQSLELKWPDPPQEKGGEWLLVYGGSTATGTLGIQFAKLNGYKVISVNGKRNDDLVKSLGPELVFDYKDPEVGKKIREATGDKLKLAFDCISEGESPKIVADAISSSGGKATFLLPLKEFPRQDVEVKNTLGYTSIGRAIRFRGNDMPAKPEDFEFAKKWMKVGAKLLGDGTIKVHPLEVRDGGLEKVHEGLDDLRKGRVSGKKIVYRIA